MLLGRERGEKASDLSRAEIALARVLPNHSHGRRRKHHGTPPVATLPHRTMQQGQRTTPPLPSAT